MRIAWIAAGGLLVMGAGLAWLKTGEPSGSGTVPLSARSANASTHGEAGTRPGPAAPAQHPATVSGSVTEPDYEIELRKADDRWDLAGKLLAEAKRGNAAAQYYLSLTLSECQAFDEMYVDSGNRRRTIDEALQLAVSRGGLNWEYVAPILNSCRRLAEAKETPFGDWGHWLREAAANGYPQAVVMTATGKAMNGVYAENPQQKEALLSEARRLAMQALRTKDPAAIAEMGSVSSWLRKSDGLEAEPEGSWLLAACQRGLDCSRESSRYRLRCAYDPECQPYEAGMVDVIRRDAGDSFAALEQRAAEINEKLDGDRFDELGL